MQSNLPDLKAQLSSEELFTAFKTQLQKDFTQSNFPCQFIEHLHADYNHIVETLATELQRESHNNNLIMSLLYRIDISEVQLKRYLQENININYFQVLSELIIKRVLQKVVTKLYYKNN